MTVKLNDAALADHTQQYAFPLFLIVSSIRTVFERISADWLSQPNIFVDIF